MPLKVVISGRWAFRLKKVKEIRVSVFKGADLDRLEASPNV